MQHHYSTKYYILPEIQNLEIVETTLKSLISMFLLVNKSYLTDSTSIDTLITHRKTHVISRLT